MPKLKRKIVYHGVDESTPLSDLVNITEAREIIGRKDGKRTVSRQAIYDIAKKYKWSYAHIGHQRMWLRSDVQATPDHSQRLSEAQTARFARP